MAETAAGTGVTASDWNRAHSVGQLCQEADLLGFALMVNSLTIARHRAREAVKAAA